MPPHTSFFTSGERREHNGSYIIVNHCYVQYIAPQPGPQSEKHGASKPATPILFVHGGGLTGSVWEVTPERRPGWGPLAAQEPFCRPVFLLDSVDHGRSQRAPDELRRGPVEHRTPMEMWRRFRFGPVDGFQSREAFDGSQFPLDHLDVLVSMQAARRRTTTDDVEARGVGDAIKEIGPCAVVAHSQGATLTLMALAGDEEVRRLVQKLVLVEPAPTVKLPVSGTLPPTLVVWGDFVMGHDGWRETMLHLRALDAEVWELPRMGVTGNSHFPMSDKNSDVVGSMILQWLSKP